MAPKKQTPAPIDRPLSRAYLREFSGWSSAYPPGLSDPTSLQVMENVMVNRDGSLRIRPGLRYLSYTEAPIEEGTGVGLDRPIVGTHEAFFLNDGSKAYLFAVREDDQTVTFRVLRFTDTTIVQRLTDPGIDFDIPQGEEALTFSAATRYVKYLQIDNRIFALSDAGETARLFYVGEKKRARQLTPIERPDWSIDDKLSVVHPVRTWITDNAAESKRTNLVLNPSFEAGIGSWITTAGSGSVKPSLPFKGTSALWLSTEPQRRNLMTHPLTDLGGVGIEGWKSNSSSNTLSIVSGWARLTNPKGQKDARRYARSPMISEGIVAGRSYRVVMDVGPVSSSATDICVLYRFYTAAGKQAGTDKTHSSTISNGRWVVSPVEAPAGAVKMDVFIGGVFNANESATNVNFRNVMVIEASEPTTHFSGASGAGYFWLGVAHKSQSIQHLPSKVETVHSKVAVAGGASYVLSAHVRSGQAGLHPDLRVRWLSTTGAELSVQGVNGAELPVDSWERYSTVQVAPADATHAELLVSAEGLARGSNFLVDAVQFEQAAALGAYFDGSDAGLPNVGYAWLGQARGSASTETVYSENTAHPVAATPAPNTLVSSVADDNDYNFGFFYTFGNEVGESAGSMVTTIRTKRGWSSWRWESPNTDGSPSGTRTADPDRAADQLVASMPQEVFDHAVAHGATHWSLYMMTWSDQDSVPPVAVKVAHRDLEENPDYAKHGWARVTALTSTASDEAVIPTETTRHNYTEPPRAGQGLVAADRMVLVKDPSAAAVIRWTSAQQGEYTNFSANKGGGFKTLTSGNLFVPAAVKLWQNPQSADTICILCLGVDGHSTSYYMAPAQVQSQSETVQVMGFEETTATAGTTSPYGCEVVNNALYHPLDEQLVKSTASNYNINHKSQTDQITDVWSRLENKEWIISSQLDNRIYYIVNNPDGEPVPQNCVGNEIWVYDAGSESGTWSRWIVPAHSLRKIEQAGKVYMSVVMADGIYFFDPDYDRDDVRDPDTVQVHTRFISWRCVTNTQGANRAHDAWAHLQQMGLTLGDFRGSLRWGLRGHDLHGKRINISKVMHDLEEPAERHWDRDDALRIARDMQQWFFFAESVEDAEGETMLSTGQLNSVQYRYTPVSVNVGYEHGSVETFEYGRSTVASQLEQTTDAGVPKPMTDLRRL